MAYRQGSWHWQLWWLCRLGRRGWLHQHRVQFHRAYPEEHTCSGSKINTKAFGAIMKLVVTPSPPSFKLINSHRTDILKINIILMNSSPSGWCENVCTCELGLSPLSIAMSTGKYFARYVIVFFWPLSYKHLSVNIVCSRYCLSCQSQKFVQDIVYCVRFKFLFKILSVVRFKSTGLISPVFRTPGGSLVGWWNPDASRSSCGR